MVDRLELAPCYLRSLLFIGTNITGFEIAAWAIATIVYQIFTVGLKVIWFL